jgi:hypothetical protein
MSELIFWGASFLTRPEIPGLVSFGILLGLIIAFVWIWVRSRRKIAALKWLEGAVGETENEAEFTAEVPHIEAKVRKRSTRKANADLAAAWNEYRETLILGPARKGIERYQQVVIQPSLSRRWRIGCLGPISLAVSIIERQVAIQAICWIGNGR